MTRKTEENISSSKTEIIEKEKLSACQVRLLPFHALVLASLVQATWSLLVSILHFNCNFNDQKLIYITESQFQDM